MFGLETKLLAALGLAAAVLGWLGWHDHKIRQQCRDEQMQAVLVLQKQASEREAQWQIDARAIDEVRHDEQRQADAALHSALERLRSRPERPSGDLPATAGSAPTGCTGAGLYRADGEFLTRFASAASAVAADLASCKRALKIGR